MGNLRPEGFDGVDLRGRTMPEEMGIVDFRGVDLRETDWRDTTSSHVNIAGADLRGARWDFCTFKLFCHALDLGAWEAHYNTAGARFASHEEVEAFLSAIKSDEHDIQPHLDFRECEGDVRKAKIDALCEALRLRIEP